jgi:hypothetical protein
MPVVPNNETKQRVKIEGDEGREPNVALVEVPPDGGAPNAAEEEGVHNAAEGPPDEEAYVGVSDLEGRASEPNTEGDGRGISLRLTQLTSGRDSGTSTIAMLYHRVDHSTTSLTGLVYIWGSTVPFGNLGRVRYIPR